MEFYFSKTFGIFDLGEVHYWKCAGCGFCVSKTHLEMSESEYSRLNIDFHLTNHYRDDNPYNRAKRYLNQALMLSIMCKHGLIRTGSWLDWGCGIGALATRLRDYFGLTLMAYDEYFVPRTNAVSRTDLLPRSFDLVVNTAVFEHLRQRKSLDQIESLVSTRGCLAVHTLVRETVPQDPDWMYLLPVHCAFFTNKSMQHLMEQWGYRSSVYNEDAKLWVMFHDDPEAISNGVGQVNESLGWEYLHFAKGFMDYWK